MIGYGLDSPFPVEPPPAQEPRVRFAVNLPLAGVYLPPSLQGPIAIDTGFTPTRRRPPWWTCLLAWFKRQASKARRQTGKKEAQP